MGQIVLPLDLRRPGDATRIVVGTANAEVIEALGRPESWPFRTAVLTGSPRSGKSLLARWFAAEGRGESIDGADSVDETTLFHRWNRAQEDGRPLLLVVNGETWDIALPDLRSRMGAALQLRIGAPDDAMVAALIEAHAQQRGLVLGEGALTYLVPRTTRSFAAIERLVETIDRLSMERKVPATQSVWRDALEAIEGPRQARLL
ncbi:MAG: ATPase [Erythrobacter sp. 34-65-8]|nr:MAG: ATPase [Erythrobacter sp. 34-65-8]